MVKRPLKWRKERGAYYDDQINIAHTDRHGIIQNREKVRELYFKEPGGFDCDEPWEGASDIHLPLIMEKVETATPKIVSAMWRADPFVHVTVPGAQDNTKLARNVERFISWAFRNDIPDFYQTWENFVRNRLIDGTAFAKIRWERKWRRTVEVHTVQLMMEPGQPDLLGKPVEEPREKSVEEMLGEVFGFGDPNNSVFDFTVKGEVITVQFVEEGHRLSAEVEIENGDLIGEVHVKVMRDVIECDSPIIENVDLEDLVMPFRTETIQKARWVAQRTWYSRRDVEQKMKDKAWDLTKADFDQMMGLSKNADDDVLGEAAKDKILGETGNTGTGKRTDDNLTDPNMCLVWEIYTEEHVDSSGKPINVVMFLPDELRKVVGVEYHDEIFPHGRIPFISDTYIPVDKRIYGIGMAEILYGLNLSMDKTINQVNNAMEIKGNPWFMYSIYGLAENAKILDGIRPGEGVPVGDVSQIMFPDFAQEPLSMFHASFQTLQGYADTLTFSPSIGGSSNYRNAPRTARGTLALMDQAEEKLSSLVEQSQASAWKDMISQVVALYGRYVSVDKWYKVTGETKTRRMSPKDLRNNFMYELSGSLTSVNRDVQRQLVERKFQILSQQPLYQNDPHAMQNLIEELLRSFTEGGNYDNQIPALPGEGGFSHPPMDQEEELITLKQGIPVEVLPIDNHMEHVKKLEAFRKSPAFETIPQWGVSVINYHEQQHMTALQQQQMQSKRAEMSGQQPQQQQQPQQGAMPEPGAPQQGQPAFGGEMSTLEGGSQ